MKWGTFALTSWKLELLALTSLWWRTTLVGCQSRYLHIHVYIYILYTHFTYMYDIHQSTIVTLDTLLKKYTDCFRKWNKSSFKNNWNKVILHRPSYLSFSETQVLMVYLLNEMSNNMTAKNPHKIIQLKMPWQMWSGLRDGGRGGKGK